MKSSKLPGMLSVKSKKGLDYMDMILKTTDLCKNFKGQMAVNNVSLNIRRNRGAYRNKAPTYAFRALKSPTGIERSGVKRIRLHDLRHSHARNRRVFLPTGIKRWTESEKYGKISIRNDIVKSEFIKEDMDETVFMFALFKCRKFDKRRN